MSAGRTFYDLLEVSRYASPEVMQASYEKLRDRLDPDLPGNSRDEAAKLKYYGLREAYVTLSNPERKKQYDARLRSLERTEVVQPFWTSTRAVVVLVCLLGSFGFYWQGKSEEAKAELAKTALERERMARIAAEKEDRESKEAARIQEMQRRTAEQQERSDLEMARRQAAQVTRQNDAARDAYDRQLLIQRQREDAARAREQKLAAVEARRRAADDERRLRELEYARIRGR